MCHNTTQSKSVQAWLTLAISAPLAHYSGGSWPMLLVLSLLAIGITGLLPEKDSSITDSKPLCFLELIWVLILAAHYIPLSAAYWPGKGSELVVPTALLLLGAYSCTGRPDKTAAVLFAFMILLLIPFGIATIKDANPKWVLPSKLQCSAWVVPILLLPAVRIWTGNQKTTSWVPCLLGLCTWCATSALLSPNLAMQLDLPFRQLSRTLDLGAGSRFESLASVWITLGWFALSSIFLKITSELMMGMGIKEKLAPWMSVVLILLLYWINVQPDPLFSAGMTLVLWVLLPILHSRKNLKKSEKSA